jgi:hypothetical protein
MWVIFAFLDPHPVSESGSTDLIESGYNLYPDPGSETLLPMVFYSIIPGPGTAEGGWGGAAVSRRAGRGVPYSG